MLYIKLFIEREKYIGQSAPECPFKLSHPLGRTLGFKGMCQCQCQLLKKMWDANTGYRTALHAACQLQLMVLPTRRVVLYPIGTERLCMQWHCIQLRYSTPNTGLPLKSGLGILYKDTELVNRSYTTSCQSAVATIAISFLSYWTHDLEI